jgi:alpha-galactosidase
VAEGEWRPHPERFPNGDASMKAFVDRIHDAGLKAKLWWVLLAADPGSRVDEQRPDWALLNEDGSRREIT